MKMLNLVNFPIWRNDKKPIVKLNPLQKGKIEEFINKIERNEYNLIPNLCLCGNRYSKLDIVVSEKDRYGIPCDIVLCKKCGLVRLKEKLDDISTRKFYENEYRDIYVGKEYATADFFSDQIQRGQIFLNLIKKYVNIGEIKNVFEIGCGAGGVLYPFHEIGKQVSGCDFGEKYLKFGIEKGLNLYYGEIDISKTAKKSQDLVILSHVMEHFNEPIKTMVEIIELIADEKYLLVEVPGIFDIPKTYFNPILYFQNAHVYNYYYYYLKIFFQKLGLKVIFGNERCTFILQKPARWVPSLISFVYDEKMELWAKRVEIALKKQYLIHFLKLNPYYIKNGIIRLLDLFGIKQFIKDILYK